MFSPLEQFDAYSCKVLTIGGLDISLINILIPLIVSILFIYGLLQFLGLDLKLVPDFWQYLIESLFKFLLDLIKQQVGPKGYIYFPFIFTIFTFILLTNLLSLTPFSFALTSHIILIFLLSFTIIFSIFLIGLLTHNLQFLKIFVPECPFLLLFILVPIEIFSYAIRSVSLAIRLSANIMAGHTLVFIISSFVLNLSSMKFWFYFVFLSVLLAILVLELVSPFYKLMYLQF